MQSDQSSALLFDPMPKRDVELPPMVVRPVEPKAGSLRRDTAPVPPALEEALANIRL
jgi:hypothetical protein